jgi:hypothetical protein
VKVGRLSLRLTQPDGSEITRDLSRDDRQKAQAQLVVRLAAAAFDEQHSDHLLEADQRQGEVPPRPSRKRNFVSSPLRIVIEPSPISIPPG